MSTTTRRPLETVEEPMQRAHRAGDHRSATSLALETYGGEVFGMMVTSLGSPTEAEEVFGVFCEDVWRGIPAFAWRSSMRTWLYTLAHHAVTRFRSDPHRRPERNVPVSEAPELEDLIVRARTTTAAYMRTESKQAVRALRDRLPSEDRVLLLLRIDRDLSWKEIAEILGEGADATAVARLRKRLDRLKRKLRRLAEQEGLLPEGATGE